VLPETRQVGRIAQQIRRPSLTTTQQVGHQIYGGRGQRVLQPILGGLQEGPEGAAHQFRFAQGRRRACSLSWASSASGSLREITAMARKQPARQRHYQLLVRIPSWFPQISNQIVAGHQASN
jgi:hypothetical protein